MNNALKIFGIVNVTSDSFSDGGKYLAPDAAIAHARKLMAEGADVIDLGPASSNPDAAPVSAATEIARIAPVLDALMGEGVPVSLDSYQPETQKYALACGVEYLNDVRGFPDASVYPALAASNAQLVVMHSIQNGQADRRDAPAGDIIDHIARFFEARIAALTSAGIARERIILDPGMGFFLGSTPQTSFTVLARFSELKARFALPVFISASRKSFLRKLTDRGANEAGAATLAAEIAIALAGVDFIRTHEPAPLRDSLKVLSALKEFPQEFVSCVFTINLYIPRELCSHWAHTGNRLEMARKYFGTDGIRGTANEGAMTAETALRVGMAAGRVFRRGDHRHRVVIGKDTRLSGYMLEPALTAGFTSMGMDVFLFGPLPTPAVAMLTRSLRADLGVMISASHNSFQDNGIKFFGPDGYKLSDEIELEIEHHIDNGLADNLAGPRDLGRAKRIDDAQARYIEHVKHSFPRDLTLEGLRIVIDCANGAAYKVAPAVLYELGADVVTLGTEPDGFNINDECGSTSPERMCAVVRERRADIGIALDGDADRLIICDENGHVIDGDQIMALIARSWKAAGKLSAPGIVSTVMSNLGLERYLNGMGLDLVRTQVGDRYVVEHMRNHGFNVGGEQSGHIVLKDFGTTGDGLVAALQILAVLKAENKPVSELCHLFDPLPQLLKNVRFKKGEPLNEKDVKAAIAEGESRLGKTGRLVIRKSGTEPLIRVMGEGDDESLVKAVVRDICTAIESHAA